MRTLHKLRVYGGVLFAFLCRGKEIDSVISGFMHSVLISCRELQLVDWLSSCVVHINTCKRLVFKETVLQHCWESETLKSGIKKVEKGQISIVK